MYQVPSILQQSESKIWCLCFFVCLFVFLCVPHVYLEICHQEQNLVWSSRIRNIQLVWCLKRWYPWEISVICLEWHILVCAILAENWTLLCSRVLQTSLELLLLGMFMSRWVSWVWGFLLHMHRCIFLCSTGQGPGVGSGIVSVSHTLIDAGIG